MGIAWAAWSWHGSVQRSVPFSFFMAHLPLLLKTALPARKCLSKKYRILLSKIISFPPYHQSAVRERIVPSQMPLNANTALPEGGFFRTPGTTCGNAGSRRRWRRWRNLTGSRSCVTEEHPARDYRIAHGRLLNLVSHVCHLIQNVSVFRTLRDSRHDDDAKCFLFFKAKWCPDKRVVCAREVHAQSTVDQLHLSAVLRGGRGSNPPVSNLSFTTRV